MPKSIIDWFDINNPEHIAAYQHVCDKGVWPIDFIPNKKAVAFPAGWPGLLAGKIAESLLAQREEWKEALILIESTFTASLDSPEETSWVQIPRFTAQTLIGRIRRLLDPFKKGEQR